MHHFTSILLLYNTYFVLQNSVSYKTLICSFSAASNVTGIISDVARITRLVKEYGGLAFWDYATGGPYLEINMNPNAEG